MTPSTKGNAMKYKWKVGPAPSRYNPWREWPEATYIDGSPAAHVTCEEGYEPEKVKAGSHKPLTLTVYCYTKILEMASSCPWERKVAKKKFATLPELKEAFKKLLEEHPEIMPKA